MTVFYDYSLQFYIYIFMFIHCYLFETCTVNSTVRHYLKKAKEILPFKYCAMFA